jgi:hypothetical protein
MAPCEGRRSSSKAGKGGGGGAATSRPPASDRSQAVDFQELMCNWDETFEEFSTDPAKAAHLEKLAREGHERSGRGFVFLRCKARAAASTCAVPPGPPSWYPLLLRTERARGPARTQLAVAVAGGAGRRSRRGGASSELRELALAKAIGAPLAANPDLALVAWQAEFLPSGILAELGALAGAGGAPLPDAGQLAAPAASGDGEALEELRRVMRGMDPGRLAALVGGEEGAPGVESTVRGERAHDPAAREFVLLLSARVAGTPAVGADVVRAFDAPGGGVALATPGLDELL